ncbi:MAG: hypothetical protein HY814_03450, partial [Candidatus Riflebacteria bacterium]|nr:hypothetical protein [Candidatus Riflebacteria bacterium]
ECQRTRLTTTSRITLTFNGKGDLTATSGRLPAGLNVKAATPPRLDDNNRAIAWFVRDDDVFFCPEYALQQGGWKVAPRTTNQYLWLSDPTPQPALSGEKRGACCLTYGSDNGTNLTKGPDGTTETAHR